MQRTPHRSGKTNVKGNEYLITIDQTDDITVEQVVANAERVLGNDLEQLWIVEESHEDDGKHIHLVIVIREPPLLPNGRKDIRASVIKFQTNFLMYVKEIAGKPANLRPIFHLDGVLNYMSKQNKPINKIY